MQKALPLLLLLAGCQQLPALPGLTPHKISIQQGNHVTQDMVDKVKPGMTRSQVRFALGTPLVVDPFHNDRWDYVYVQQKGGRVVEKRRLIVVFKDDALVRIEGDALPAKETAASGKGAALPAKEPAASGKEAAIPPKETAASGKEAVIPPKETAASGKEVAVPEAVTSAKEAASPAKESPAPETPRVTGTPVK